MRKIRSLNILALGIFLLSACQSDSGYDTLEEAIQIGTPYKVKEVIHIEKTENLTIVLYTTKSEGEQFKFAPYDALTVAFFEGNNRTGWQYAGPNGWNHYKNDDMTVYYEEYRKHDNEGDVIKEVPVTFGRIYNPKIQRVETKAKNSNEFLEIKIIEKNGVRF
jgi:hypothetical protein